jgi:inner membrane protein
MASIISHAAVPLALGIGLGRKNIPRPLMIAGVAASMLPDADVILFRFGTTYADPWSHRGASHSLFFASLVGLAAARLMRRVAPPLLTFVFVTIAGASHGLLDMLTNGGHGIALLWPFSTDRYFFVARPIQVSPLAAHRFVIRAAAVARTEALWIWAPAIVVAGGLRAWRRRKEARS